MYILAMFAIVLTACNQKTIEPLEVVDADIIQVTKAQFEGSKMQIEQLKTRDFDQTLTVTGAVEVPPKHKAVITSLLGGYIKSCDLQVGARVERGQTLMVLENPAFIDIQKDFIEVAQQIKYLKSEFERQKTLYEEKISSQKNFYKAESDYLQANGMYQSLKEKLQLLQINSNEVLKGNITSQVAIKSPISGQISQSDAAVGSFKAASEMMMEVIDIDYLQLQLFIFEKDIMTIRKGQKVKFKIVGNDLQQFDATVALVGNSIENKDRTVTVYATLNSETELKFIAGMFVEAKIVVSTKKGWSIPKEALWIENDKTYLLVQNDPKEFKFNKLKVEVGVKEEQFVEIMPQSNLNEQTNILTKGVFELR